jgi:NCAIR mutase (PurE)-related protein
MLTACASGITVVNIDNGFGAAVAASKIQQAILEGQMEKMI